MRSAKRIAAIAALVGLGWVAAKAQTSEPDFEVVVTAPSGETTIECVRGCELAWVQRGLNPNSKPMQSFTFKCGGGATDSPVRRTRLAAGSNTSPWPLVDPSRRVGVSMTLAPSLSR
jgi:hypothetical protein